MFFIVTKGEVVITNPAVAFAEGAVVYLTTATNALATSTGVKYGRVKEIAPTRGLATGKVRVDLDAKDQF